MEEVKIGDNVTKLNDLFSNSPKLRKITLGKNLKEIVSEAFSLCSSPDTVICRSLEPPHCGSNVFAGVFLDKSVLIVPEDSYSKYAETYP